jgi:hypothetical protein
MKEEQLVVVVVFLTKSVKGNMTQKGLSLSQKPKKKKEKSMKPPKKKMTTLQSI